MLSLDQLGHTIEPLTELSPWTAQFLSLSDFSELLVRCRLLTDTTINAFSLFTALIKILADDEKYWLHGKIYDGSIVRLTWKQVGDILEEMPKIKGEAREKFDVLAIRAQRSIQTYRFRPSKDGLYGYYLEPVGEQTTSLHGIFTGAVI